MPPLTQYFAETSLDRLKSHLAPAVENAVREIIGLLDGDGKANAARIHETLFALATTASKNASLNRVIHEFNAAAEKAGQPVRMAITAAKSVGAPSRWVWFEGPALGPQSQRTPELAAIPQERLVDGQLGMPLEPVVVLLTVNPHETSAVLRTFVKDRTPDTQTKAGVTYNLLGRVGGLRIFHVICEQGSGTVGAAQSRVHAAISAWEPRAVIAVGIAFGMNPDKQHIGDVLVSTHIRDYEIARVNAGGTITPRGSKPDASPCLLNRIKTLDQSKAPTDRVDWPRLHFGTLLSGEKLVDDLDYRESLRKVYEVEAIGGEMEAAGLYAAAFESRVDWIVVKAICDWGDGKKGENKETRQTLAAKNAALVVRRALEAPGLFEGPTRGEITLRRRPQEATSGLDRRWHAPAAAWMGLVDIDTVAGCLEKETRGSRTTLHKDRPEDLKEKEAGSVDVLRYLMEWVGEPGAPPLFALLGEYGMGKTITCQRLVRALDEQRKQDPTLPVPVYFDLRHVTGLREGLPTLQDTVEECIRRGWHAADNAFGFAEFEQLVDQGALVIFDGLDEVLVKLNEADGQAYTNQLVKLLSDARERRERAGSTAGSEPRLLISCRTQYFRTLRDQKTHFTGQERGDHGPEACRALVLLPFSEEQVRRYLLAALPGADPDRLIEMIRSVHDLEDLTRRPYTLKLVAEFIPEIEADRAAGRAVTGVTLYRRMVMRWLDRDKGKHHILPDHKLRLAAHLAAEMSRSGSNVLAATKLESWFHRWLEEQSDLKLRYARLNADQLEEDLRTATFLVRHDAPQESDCGFRFAHTSLQEFFLADYLLEAVRANKPERWALPRSSPETLDFLGQMLHESGGAGGELLASLQSWRRSYRAGVSELLFAYALRAHRRGWPVPIVHGLDLRGANLRGWEIGELESLVGSRALDLGPACFAGADLRQARFFGARMEGTDFTGARLDQAEFHDCALGRARFDAAEADGATFRRCRLEASGWDGAKTWRTRFVNGAPPVLPPASVQAPVPLESLPERSRLALLSGHLGGVLSCAFSHDGARALSADAGGTLRLWDAASGECLRVASGHRGFVWSCAFSPDGAQLLSAGADGTLRLWNAASGESLRVLSGLKGEDNSCAFSPDGAQLLSAGADGTLRLWDAASGESLRVLSGHRGCVWSCAFSPDGSQLLSAGADGTLRLWDAASGEFLRVLSGHQGEVNSCAFSPDGTLLLSAGDDGTLRLWDAASGESLRVLSGHQGGVNSCSFSPDGTLLLSADGGTLRLWDTASGECLRVVPGPGGFVWSCAFSPDGAQLLSAGDDGTLRLWDAVSGESLRVLSGHEGFVWSCAFSRDGARLLSDDGGTLRLWDAATGECLQILSGHQGYVWSWAISPDGARLLSADYDGTLHLWDTSSGKSLRVLSGHEKQVTSCAFSPDGARLLSAGADGTLRLWDASSGKSLRVLSGHEKQVTSCAFSPNGTRLLSAGDDGTLRLWNAASGESLRVLSGHQGGVNSCAFSPDGTQLLSAGNDGTLRLWNAASGESLRVLSGHQGGVNSCAFSPDGTQLLSAADDGTLRLWDATSGECLRILSGHLRFVMFCAFSPDDTQLLSVGWEGTLRLWDATSGECLRVHACLGGDHAVWEPATSTLVEATEGAWRWLHWQGWVEGDGWMPFPLESLGPVPAPKRMLTEPGPR